MRALVFSDIRTVTMGDKPRPDPAADEVVIKVIGAGICGSDMAGFLGHSPRRRPPLVLGHEIVGTVETPPAEGGRPFNVGDRVTINPLMPCGVCEACRTGQLNICASWRLLGMDRVPGGFAEYVAVRAANVFPIPNELSNEAAVMIEPLANTVHLFGLISRHQFGRIAIFGAGTQGALMISMARLLGYREIAVVDVNPERLAVAQKLGAKHIINARDGDPATAIGAHFPNGADIVIEAHGDQATREAAVNAVRKGGEVLLLGLHEVRADLDFAAIVRNEIRLQGSFGYTPTDFARSKQLIESGNVDLTPWTVTRPLEEGQAAFDLLASNPGSTLKIVLST